MFEVQTVENETSIKHDLPMAALLKTVLPMAVPLRTVLLKAVLPKVVDPIEEVQRLKKTENFHLNQMLSKEFEDELERTVATKMFVVVAELDRDSESEKFGIENDLPRNSAELMQVGEEGFVVTLMETESRGLEDLRFGKEIESGAVGREWNCQKGIHG